MQKKIVSICLLFLLSCSFYAIGNTQKTLDIFELFPIEHMGPKFYFTSVSEKIIFNPYDKDGRRETNIFEPDPTDNYKKEQYLLTKKNRQRFLSASKISETDTLFVYDYVKNQLYSFSINQLSAFAIKDVYSGGIDETEYNFGFAIMANQLPPDFDPYKTSFVYIGEKNPFAQQQLTLLNWQESNDKAYDYVAQAYGLHYYVTKCFAPFGYPACERLVVKNKKNSILFDHDYQNGDAQPTPLNGKDKDQEYKMQWSGKLFKNKPLAVIGFVDVVFGCATIDFIEPSYKSLTIKCDNRH